jgi:hypothetical protein
MMLGKEHACPTSHEARSRATALGVIVSECILLLDTRLGRQNVAHRVGLFSEYLYPSMLGSHASVNGGLQYAEINPGLFVYTGASLGNESVNCDIKLNFDMYVPAGHRGDEALSIAWYVTRVDVPSEWVQSTDNGQIIEDLSPAPKIGTVIFGR